MKCWVAGPWQPPAFVVLTQDWGWWLSCCSGQELDPTCGWRQREAELHCAGWGEAMHRDSVRCAAPLRVAQPHWQAQSDGEATGIPCVWSRHEGCWVRVAQLYLSYQRLLRALPAHCE